MMSRFRDITKNVPLTDSSEAAGSQPAEAVSSTSCRVQVISLSFHFFQCLSIVQVPVVDL